MTAPLQLYLLNATLASSPVSYAVPVYQALLVLLTTAAGGLFFGEFERTTLAGDCAYAGGGVLAIAGLSVLGAAASAAGEGAGKQHEKFSELVEPQQGIPSSDLVESRWELSLQASRSCLNPPGPPQTAGNPKCRDQTF